jgi:hypothetical protein
MKFQPPILLTVFFAVLIGAFSFEDIGPGVTLVSQGGASCAKIFQAIDRTSAIDPFSKTGKQLPKKTAGGIQFQNVSFRYLLHALSFQTQKFYCWMKLHRPWILQQKVSFIRRYTHEG